MKKSPVGRAARAAVGLFTLSSLTLPVAAQCGFEWQPGPSSAGPDRTVHALTRLANGDLVATGDFSVIDDTFADRVAIYDGAQWTGIGAGFNAAVVAALELTNGNLVVGGNFGLVGAPFPQPAGGVAVWNGTTWQTLSGGTNSAVTSLMQLANGDLVVGGAFFTAGGVPARRVARWDGFSWSAFGNGLQSGTVKALLELPNGDILAGGNFGPVSSVGGPAGLALWDGTSWSSPPGFPIGNHDVRALALLPNGDVAVAGSLAWGAPATRVAIWDGTNAVALNAPLNEANALAVDANGDLLAGGRGSLASVARYSGGAWTPVAGAPEIVAALQFDGADLVAGGNGGTTLTGALSIFDGQSWRGTNSATPTAVYASLRLPNGELIVGGSFSELGGVPVDNIARFDGDAWHALGFGVDGNVTSLALDVDGTVLVGGTFQTAGGAPAQSVARWDGSNWATVGAGLPQAPSDLAVSAQGDVFALRSTGLPQLDRFDGATWSAFPIATSGVAMGLQTLANGDVALHGLLTSGVTHGVAVFDGVAFQPLDAGSGAFVLDVIPTPDGDFLVRGSILGVGTVARWDGVAYQPLPTASAPVRSLGYSVDGQLFALVDERIERLDGGAWTSVTSAGRFGVAGRLAFGGDNDLIVYGPTVFGVDELVSIGVARAEPTCPASAVSFGAGCVGSAGTVRLNADGAPWLGGTMRATATGFPQASLALLAIGAQQVTAPLPLGAAGCSLFVDPVATELRLPAAGAVDASFDVPDVAALIGQLVYTQVIGVELGAGSSLQQLTGTNALQLTIGSL